MAVWFDAGAPRPARVWHAASRMPNASRTTIIAIGAVIAIPLIFAALGATRAAGLALGVILVAIGVGWSVLGSRPSDPDDG
jgi:hypothetical protein